MQRCTCVRVDAASRCSCSGGYNALQSFENAAEISDRSAALCMQLGDLVSCVWYSRPRYDGENVAKIKVVLYMRTQADERKFCERLSTFLHIGQLVRPRDFYG